jgi:hypothetical protein
MSARARNITQFLVDEIEIVMKAFAIIGNQIRLAGLFVVQGLRINGSAHQRMCAWRIATAAALISGTLAAQSAFEVHGYIQGRFTDQLGTPERLEIRRARLIVFGDPLPKFSYRFQVDVAKKPYLMDASIAYRPVRQFTVSLVSCPNGS